MRTCNRFSVFRNLDVGVGHLGFEGSCGAGHHWCGVLAKHCVYIYTCVYYTHTPVLVPELWYGNTLNKNILKFIRPVSQIPAAAAIIMQPIVDLIGHMPIYLIVVPSHNGNPIIERTVPHNVLNVDAARVKTVQSAGCGHL